MSHVKKLRTIPLIFKGSKKKRLKVSGTKDLYRDYVKLLYVYVYYHGEDIYLYICNILHTYMILLLKILATMMMTIVYILLSDYCYAFCTLLEQQQGHLH